MIMRKFPKLILTYREHLYKIMSGKFPKGGDMGSIEDIRVLIQEKAELEARLSLMPYDGSPEIKENKSGKYLYVRKRVGGKLTSKYVDVYSDELYQLLIRNTKESRELKKAIRTIDKKLAEAGYEKADLSADVVLNLDLARANLKTSIYDQAVLEGVSTTFPQTEDIIENGTVNGMTASDVQKILNLKHAWEFILDEDVIQAKSDYYMLCHIAKIVNEGFYSDGGRIRGVPVTIGGCNYVPPIPVESVVKDRLTSIVDSGEDYIDIAIKMCMYAMRTQVFIDGNKRASVIFANHYLISRGQGFIIVPEKHISKFKKLLVEYYERDNIQQIMNFLKEKCWIKIR